MIAREDQKNQVQQATDIIRLVGEQIALRPRGKEFIGLCPFHDDKNPSLYVSPAKQIYKCFACGAGGDVFSFAMNYHKMTFPEALRHLAERAGITLQESGRGQSEGPTDRQLIADANAKAMAYYQGMYRHPQQGATAREYVKTRRISAEMIEAFQIGYAPDSWDSLAQAVYAKKFNVRSFEMAGLISRRQNAEGHYDRLRHRLIFPICDAIGRCIAFGGRKLREEDEPKYLNSPETALFNKSATLYGLYQAKKPIIDSRTAVLVEGYTDVIACHQAGFRNVVATLGTALTNQHVAELRRYCEKVVLIYDADEAGLKAADRAVEVFLTGDLDVAIAVLPEELDPADLFERPDGAERWRKATEQAQDALSYQFSRVRASIESADTVTRRQKLAEEYLRSLAQLGLGRSDRSSVGPGGAAGGMIRQALVMQRLAEMLRLPEESIRSILKSMAPSRPAAAAAAPASPMKDQANNTAVDVAEPQVPHRIVAAERELIGCLLRQPGLFYHTLTDGRTLDESLTPAELLTDPGRRLYGLVYQLLSESREATLPAVLAELAQQGEQDLANLATEADLDIERHATGHDTWLTETLAKAAEAILTHRAMGHYVEARQQALSQVSNQGTQQSPEEIRLQRSVMEQHRPGPVPRGFKVARGKE